MDCISIPSVQLQSIRLRTHQQASSSYLSSQFKSLYRREIYLLYSSKMHGPAFATSLLPLFSLALATPFKRQDFFEFNITSLSATFPYPGPYGVDSVDSFVRIAVTWPESMSTESGTVSTTCEVDWEAGVTPGPTDWTPCANTTLQFRLPADGWTSTTNFRVQLYESLTPEG